MLATWTNKNGTMEHQRLGEEQLQHLWMLGHLQAKYWNSIWVLYLTQFGELGVTLGSKQLHSQCTPRTGGAPTVALGTARPQSCAARPTVTQHL